MRKLISIKSFFVMLAFATLISPLFINGTAQATTVGSPAGAVDVTPGCSDPVAGLTYWNVTNNNPNNVDLSWNNINNNATGVYSAPSGVSVMPTTYVASDPNNTTKFSYGATAEFQTNAPASACAPVVVTPPPVVVVPPTPECINGSIQQNLVITWLTTNTVTVTTKDGLPLCEDVTIFFSSYVMPANYNGAGFYGNPTAYPQTIFGSVSVVLKAGVVVNETLTVNLPTECNNVQVDVYYGPEITMVGPNGHGTQNIESRVYPSTGPCAGKGSVDEPTTPPVVVDTGKGAGVQPLTNPADLTRGQDITAQYPDELPKTGGNMLAMLLLLPLFVTLVSYIGAYEFQTRRARNY